MGNQSTTINLSPTSHNLGLQDFTLTPSSTNPDAYNILDASFSTTKFVSLPAGTNTDWTFDTLFDFTDIIDDLGTNGQIRGIEFTLNAELASPPPSGDTDTPQWTMTLYAPYLGPAVFLSGSAFNDPNAIVPAGGVSVPVTLSTSGTLFASSTTLGTGTGGTEAEGALATPYIDMSTFYYPAYYPTQDDVSAWQDSSTVPPVPSFAVYDVVDPTLSGSTWSYPTTGEMFQGLRCTLSFSQQGQQNPEIGIFGPFALTVFYNQAPSAGTITVAGLSNNDSSVTIETTTPVVSWVYSDPEGDPQASYRVLVFDGTGNSFKANVTNPAALTKPNGYAMATLNDSLVYDSGTMTQGGSNFTIPSGVLKANHFYTVQVIVSDYGSNGRPSALDDSTQDIFVTLDPVLMPSFTPQFNLTSPPASFLWDGAYGHFGPLNVATRLNWAAATDANFEAAGDGNIGNWTASGGATLTGVSSGMMHGLGCGQIVMDGFQGYIESAGIPFPGNTLCTTAIHVNANTSMNVLLITQFWDNKQNLLGSTWEQCHLPDGDWVKCWSMAWAPAQTAAVVVQLFIPGSSGTFLVDCFSVTNGALNLLDQSSQPQSSTFWTLSGCSEKDVDVLTDADDSYPEAQVAMGMANGDTATLGNPDDVYIHDAGYTYLCSAALDAGEVKVNIASDTLGAGASWARKVFNSGDAITLADNPSTFVITGEADDTVVANFQLEPVIAPIIAAFTPIMATVQFPPVQKMGAGYGILDATYDRNTITDPVGTVTNYVKNTSANDFSFETGVGDWSATNATIASSSTQALDGSKSLAITASSTGNVEVGTGSETYTVGTEGLVRADLWIRPGSTARSVTIGMAFYATGTFKRNSPNKTFTEVAGEWIYIAVEDWLDNANGENGIGIGVTIDGCASGEIHYIDVVSATIESSISNVTGDPAQVFTVGGYSKVNVTVTDATSGPSTFTAKFYDTGCNLLYVDSTSGNQSVTFSTTGSSTYSVNKDVTIPTGAVFMMLSVADSSDSLFENLTVTPTGSVAPTQYLDGGWSYGSSDQNPTVAMYRSVDGDGWTSPVREDGGNGYAVPVSISMGSYSTTSGTDSIPPTPIIQYMDIDWVATPADQFVPGSDTLQYLYAAQAGMSALGLFGTVSPSRAFFGGEITEWTLSDPTSPDDDCILAVKTAKMSITENMQKYNGMGRSRVVVVGDRVQGDVITLELFSFSSIDFAKYMTNIKKQVPLVLRSPDGEVWWVRPTKRDRTRTWTGSYQRQLRSHQIELQEIDPPQ